MQLTDRRIYFTWYDHMRRQDIPLYEEAENVDELRSPPSPPATPIPDRESEVPPIVGAWIGRTRGYSFTRGVPLGLT